MKPESVCVTTTGTTASGIDFQTAGTGSSRELRNACVTQLHAGGKILKSSVWSLNLLESATEDCSLSPVNGNLWNASAPIRTIKMNSDTVHVGMDIASGMTGKRSERLLIET